MFVLTAALYQIIRYVNIGEKQDNAFFAIRYIGRYAKKPAISKTKTISVKEFMGRLIRHIPEKNFRMIRYYGLCVSAVKNKLSLAAHLKSEADLF